MSAPEITGRKPFGAVPPASKRAGRTVSEFCAAYTISRRTFEVWKKKGIAPKVVQPAGPGGRQLITTDAEDAWKRQFTGLAATIEAAE
jgi:hypothetical protein